jgi:hypothetical protein
MREITAEASLVFPAKAEDAYSVIADYRVGHPSILPRRYFTYLEVESGGRGAGTTIRFGMKIGGMVRHARAEISEPHPGRVLVERMLDDRGTVTTFRVEPVGAERVRVTIRTSWLGRGLAGVVESWTAPALLRRIYREELRNLAEVAAGGVPNSS